MAGINFPRYTFSDATTIKQSVAEDVVIVNQLSTRLVDAISPTMNNLPTPMGNIKYEWVEDQVNIFATTLQTTETSAETTIVVGSGEGEYILAGHILLIGSEQLLVTTAGTAADVVTVARGYGTTDPATHSSGVAVTIVGRTAVEGANAPTDTFRAATMPWNAAQIFEAVVDLTLTAQMEQRWGEADPWDREMMKSLRHLMVLFERQIIHGERVARSGATLATAGTFGGVSTYIASGNKNALSSARMTKDDVDDLLQEIFALVGEEFMPDLIVCNSYNKRRFSSFYEPFVRTERSDRQGGAPIESILTEWGVLDIQLNHNMPSNRVDFYHTPFMAVGPFQGNGYVDDFGWVPLAKANTSRREKRHLSGQYTFKMSNPNCHGQLTGTATS